ncbi:MAG: hypothetical protein QNJ74_05185 [Trichodesmium sp. MO_231.B1]|nr:hypothetical protein [Trichodesmium sp. MO_231.B1]
MVAIILSTQTDCLIVRASLRLPEEAIYILEIINNLLIWQSGIILIDIDSAFH